MAMINCPECTKEISDQANACPNCGLPIQKNESSASEIVLKEGLANQILKMLYVQNGRGAVTNKRFIYYKHGIGKILIIGALANFTKGDIEFDIPLEDIVEFRKGRQGLNTVLTIETKDETFKFVVFGYGEWERALNKALNRT